MAHMWFPIEQDVKDNIDVEEDAFHRYLAARCFL